MLKRIAAIAFIFGCTTFAWIILGSTIFYRTYGSDSALEGRVVSSWGAPQEQAPPGATYQEAPTRTEARSNEGKGAAPQPRTVALPLESSHIEVALNLEPRQKGLLWYSTYKVAFAGRYVFRNTSPQEQAISFALPFPAERAIYDDLVFTVDGAPLSAAVGSKGAYATARVSAGKAATLQVAYRSQGLASWRYKLGGDVSQARDFVLQMRTNFKDIDFPENSISPTEKRPTVSGWELTWSYKNLISGYQVALAMPEKLQPGPLAGRISYFGPVSLFFFFFLMFIITTLRDIELHPMNYFFLAAAFFAFHLLLAYLVDHISIHTAFAISALVSIVLVVSYLRLVIGLRFAAVEAGLTQFFYLVLFSYAFFFKGFTGLTVTIGSILTLFVVMQATGRIRWAEKFAAAAPRRPLREDG